MKAHDRPLDAFSNAVLFYDDHGAHANSWTRSIHAGLRDQNFDEVPFRVPQLLEPAVLDEVGHLHGLTAPEIEAYSYDLRGPIVTLKWLYDMLEWATPVQRLNLAVCLCATCRYRVAQQVLAAIPYRSLHTDQKIAFHIAKFVIDNRLDRTDQHQSDFTRLKEIIEAERVSPERVLDVSAQAVVWSVKTNSLERSLLAWFVEAGHRAADRLATPSQGSECIALSSFYRGYAMIPAAAGDAAETRRCMTLAERYAADAGSGKGAGVSEISLRDARKTVLESKLKEMLYVARDLERARQAGRELIDLDRDWSISYHEAAEVEIAEADFAAALRLFEQALAIGLPRRTFSQYMIGACLQQLGRIDAAIAAFKATLEMDPTNLSAGMSGFKLAASHAVEHIPFFRSHIDGWERDGLLLPEHRSMLQ